MLSLNAASLNASKLCTTRESFLDFVCLDVMFVQELINNIR